MSHRRSAICAILVFVSLSGCMAIHTGPGCVDSCMQCDDCCPPPIPCNPWQGLHQACRSTVCGGGCGEVYYGEWLSTPPDCVDPCGCDAEWTGECYGKCYPLVRIFSALSCLHGRRFRCDDTPGLFDICTICQHACCDGGCDNCPSCCGDESYIEDGPVYYGDETISTYHEGSTNVVIGELDANKFRPMPRTRVASSGSLRTAGATKPPCNCGKHAP